MTGLIEIFRFPAVHALGWTLLHFCWQGILIAMFLACALSLLQGRSARLRYAVCCIALGLMAALPLYTFLRLAEAPRSAPELIAAAPAGLSLSLDNGGGTAGTALPWLERFAQHFDPVLPWVTSAWLAGVLLLLARLNLGLLITYRLKSRATEPVPADLRRLTQELSHLLGIRRVVGLLNSARVQSPAVIGWLRPVILFPVGCLAGLSAVQVEALVVHELAHIRRHDYLVGIFQSLVEALLFYHPAVWWVSRQVRREREHCCDDLAVALSGDSLAYAKALLSLEEMRSSVPMTALGATGGILSMRIRRLLVTNQASGNSRVAAAFLLLAVAAAGLCLVATVRAQSAAAPLRVAGSAQAAGEPAGPYEQWLNEDVRWIISPEERAAFLQLSRNDERDQFIREFWERRNPHPGSPENSYRQEHYRRIAYANVHFPSAGEAGWRTDRGRIYILYGPPDSIDSHPGGLSNGPSSPTEDWHYRELVLSRPQQVSSNATASASAFIARRDEDMRFVDLCSCGDYQLQASPGR